MTATQSFRFKDYELKCSARACGDGHFEPALVICRQLWPTRPRSIVLRHGAYPSMEVAIDSAYAQGVEWVTKFG